MTPGLIATAVAALLVSVTALLAFGAGSSSAAATSYTVKDLGAFHPQAINDNGQVVGYRYYSGGTKAVTYTADGVLRDLALPTEVAST